MSGARHLALVSALVLAAPAVQLNAQGPWGASGAWGYGRAAYEQGYQRGEQLGAADARRGMPFDFRVASDYRRGDLGYRSQYGARDRYQQGFRAGFEAGYRAGYTRFSRGRSYGPPGPPAWSRGRARGRSDYGYLDRYDLAVNNGFNDGYREGLNDGRKRHANDPFNESRYRNGDRGYERYYGSKDLYRINYRQGFIEGYETGYQDGWRYR